MKGIVFQFNFSRFSNNETIFDGIPESFCQISKTFDSPSDLYIQHIKGRVVDFD